MKHIPLKYLGEQGDASALAILKSFDPEWKSGSFGIKRLSEDNVNTLLKFERYAPGRSITNGEKEAVLLRAYDADTAIFVDQNMEARTSSLVVQHELSLPPLACFENGLLYQLTQSRVCTTGDLGVETVWRAVAAKLGRSHTLLPSHSIRERDIWNVLQQLVDALPANTTSATATKISLGNELHKAHAELRQSYGESDAKFVFGHCDLSSANIIIPENQDVLQHELDCGINFIGYEYAMFCSASFDIANHLSEWAGFECDYTLLPTRAVRRAFIEQYFHSSNTQTSERRAPLGAQTEALMDEVDAYRAIPGLFWGLQALLRSKRAHLGLDWASYAETRLDEFWAWGHEVDGSRARSGQDVPLREQRWAQEE